MLRSRGVGWGRVLLVCLGCCASDGGGGGGGGSLICGEIGK